MKNVLLLVIGAVSLAACGGLREARQATEDNISSCPTAFALGDTARLIEFDGDPKLENVAWSAEILDVRTSCRFLPERPISAEVEIDFAVGKGPKADDATKNLTYFVAVTRRDQYILEKAEFTVPVKFKDGIATVRFSDKVDEILIPRKNNEVAGVNFEIAVGLSMTRSQVLYNRSGQSLKYPQL